MKSILVTFPEETGITFITKFEGQIHESQFEVAGRELVAIAAILRSARLERQITVKTETGQPAGEVGGSIGT